MPLCRHSLRAPRSAQAGGKLSFVAFSVGRPRFPEAEVISAVSASRNEDLTQHWADPPSWPTV
jgi:hypothetical protein